MSAAARAAVVGEATGAVTGPDVASAQETSASRSGHHRTAIEFLEFKIRSMITASHAEQQARLTAEARVRELEALLAGRSQAAEADGEDGPDKRASAGADIDAVQKRNQALMAVNQELVTFCSRLQNALRSMSEQYRKVCKQQAGGGGAQPANGHAGLQQSRSGVTLADLRREVTELRKKLRAAHKRAAALSQHSSAMESERDTAVASLRKVKGSLSSLRGRHQKLSARAQTLKKKLDAALKERNDMRMSAVQRLSPLAAESPGDGRHSAELQSYMAASVFEGLRNENAELAARNAELERKVASMAVLHSQMISSLAPVVPPPPNPDRDRVLSHTTPAAAPRPSPLPPVNGSPPPQQQRQQRHAAPEEPGADSSGSVLHPSPPPLTGDAVTDDEGSQGSGGQGWDGAADAKADADVEADVDAGADAGTGAGMEADAELDPRQPEAVDARQLAMTEDMEADERNVDAGSPFSSPRATSPVSPRASHSASPRTSPRTPPTFDSADDDDSVADVTPSRMRIPPPSAEVQRIRAFLAQHRLEQQQQQQQQEQQQSQEQQRPLQGSRLRLSDLGADAGPPLIPPFSDELSPEQERAKRDLMASQSSEVFDQAVSAAQVALRSSFATDNPETADDDDDDDDLPSEDDHDDDDLPSQGVAVEAPASPASPTVTSPRSRAFNDVRARRPKFGTLDDF